MTVGTPLGQDVNRRILIVEDHTMLAEALALGLTTSSGALECTIADLSSPRSVVDQARELKPNLVLLDLDLGRADGLDLVRGLRSSGARVLLVTGCHDEARLAAALSLGSEGWINKGERFELLIDKVLVALSGRPLLPARRQADLKTIGREHLDHLRSGRERLGRLTAREREVLAALERGKSAEEIRTELYVSLATVRSHIRSILTKLEVTSQLAAVAVARSYGLANEGSRSPAA
jgi:DNA-binding NarL/FixJ family response regulator